MVEWNLPEKDCDGAITKYIHSCPCNFVRSSLGFLVWSSPWMIRGQPRLEDKRKSSESQDVVGLYILQPPPLIHLYMYKLWPGLSIERWQTDNSCKLTIRW